MVESSSAVLTQSVAVLIVSFKNIVTRTICVLAGVNTANVLNAAISFVPNDANSTTNLPSTIGDELIFTLKE